MKAEQAVLISLRQFSSCLGVPISAVGDLIRLNLVQCVNIDGKTQIPVSEYDDIMEAVVSTTTGDCITSDRTPADLIGGEEALIQFLIDWNLLQTCGHEATHAVLSCWTHQRFATVDVIKEGNILGRVQYYAPPKGIRAAPDTDERSKRFIDRAIVIFLGGVYCQYEEKAGHSDDSDQAHGLAAKMCGEKATAEEYLAPLITKTQELLQDVVLNRAVQLVAMELFRRHTMRYPEVLSIVRRCIDERSACMNGN